METAFLAKTDKLLVDLVLWHIETRPRRARPFLRGIDFGKWAKINDNG